MRQHPSVAEVEAYLHRHIPLSADMGITVLACDAAGVRLAAPLAPNINHRATVFGGSASAAAILAAWTWLHFELHAAGHEPRLVIQRNSVEYLAPIASTFEAQCAAPDPAEFADFLKTYTRHGKARMTLSAELRCQSKCVATFSGVYVALNKARAGS